MSALYPQASAFTSNQFVESLAGFSAAFHCQKAESTATDYTMTPTTTTTDAKWQQPPCSVSSMANDDESQELSLSMSHPAPASFTSESSDTPSPCHDASEEEKVRIAVEMFRTRLLRKAYRPTSADWAAAANEGQNAPVHSKEIMACEKDFINVIRSTLRASAVECVQWSTQCAEFSEKWPHVSHWLHPGRLAYFLSTTLRVKFTGRLLVSQPKERLTVRAKKYKCVECAVVCNSLRQYSVHEKGRKHIENVRIVSVTAQRRGGHYVSKSPLPLNGDTASSDVYYCPLSTDSVENCKNGSTTSGTGSAQRARLEALAAEACKSECGGYATSEAESVKDSSRAASATSDDDLPSLRRSFAENGTEAADHELIFLLESLLPTAFEG